MRNPSSSNDSPMIDVRVEQARELWLQGVQAEQQGRWQDAYALHTQAHDLVIDCPAMHADAHRYLRRVNLRLGHWGELTTDLALAVFAPLGVFALVAWFSRSSARLYQACRHA